MTYSLTWLPAVLRAAGLTVIEQPGWQTRGHGDMSKVEGVLCHHTAECRDANTEPALNVITNGRPGLAGPLCNLGLGQAGTYWMVAAGKAYHAGRGLWKGVAGSFNHCLIGIEAENDGIGEKWPEVQTGAYAKGCAAIAKHCGFGIGMVLGHKEYCLPKGRKSDPSFDMNEFRKRVAGYMA
jgi:hypothetical protein